MLVSSFAFLFNFLRNVDGIVKRRISGNTRRWRCEGQVIWLSRCVWDTNTIWLLSVSFVSGLHDKMIKGYQRSSGMCKVKRFNSHWNLTSEYLGVLIPCFSTDTLFFKPVLSVYFGSVLHMKIFFSFKIEPYKILLCFYGRHFTWNISERVFTHKGLFVGLAFK